MLVQLSGVPGTGKSTLARSLATELDLVVLDTDVVKSALMATDVPFAAAGRATYAAVLALAADLLAQGRSVVVDSPCRYPELLAAGQRAAADADVPFRLVELWAEDPADLLPRLTARTARPSQVTPVEPSWELGSPVETLRGWQAQLVRPETGWLRVDALADPATTLADVREWLLASVGPGGGECWFRRPEPTLSHRCRCRTNTQSPPCPPDPLQARPGLTPGLDPCRPVPRGVERVALGGEVDLGEDLGVGDGQRRGVDRCSSGDHRLALDGRASASSSDAGDRRRRRDQTGRG